MRFFERSPHLHTSGVGKLSNCHLFTLERCLRRQLKLPSCWPFRFKSRASHRCMNLINVTHDQFNAQYAREYFLIRTRLDNNICCNQCGSCTYQRQCHIIKWIISFSSCSGACWFPFSLCFGCVFCHRVDHAILQLNAAHAQPHQMCVRPNTFHIALHE